MSQVRLGPVEYRMDPPIKKLLLPRQVAEFIQNKQFRKYTGRVVLLMQDGNIIAIREEDAHATSH